MNGSGKQYRVPESADTWTCLNCGSAWKMADNPAYCPNCGKRRGNL